MKPHPVVTHTTDSHFLLELDCWNFEDVQKGSEQLTRRYDLGDFLILKSGYPRRYHFGIGAHENSKGERHEFWHCCVGQERGRPHSLDTAVMHACARASQKDPLR